MIKAKLVALKEDFGGYITYVFENLTKLDVYDKYIMCVRFPNWDCDFIDVGEEGFLRFKYVTSGKDKWYNKETGEYEYYKYTDCHFLNFIKDSKSQEIIL